MKRLAKPGRISLHDSRAKRGLKPSSTSGSMAVIIGDSSDETWSISGSSADKGTRLI